VVLRKLSYKKKRVQREIEVSIIFLMRRNATGTRYIYCDVILVEEGYIF
jgi:hypothetical protein